MTIGIPKEIKEQEQRVGLLPSTAQTLVGHGHAVLVQKNAGVGSGYPDEEYAQSRYADRRIGRGNLPARGHDRKSERTVAGGVAVVASRTNSFHLSSFGGEQTFDRSVAQVWGDRRCLRDDSNRKSPSAFGTNERNRGTYVGSDGRLLFGKTQWRHGCLAGRGSGGFAGPRGCAWRGDRWCECRAYGNRSGGRRYHSRSRSRTDAFSRHYDGQRPHAIFQRGASPRIDGDDRSAHWRGPRTRSESAEVNYAARCYER